MFRSITAVAAVAALGLAVFSTAADARGPGGVRGGFTGGARMGGPSFRAAGPSFRAAGPSFRSNNFVARGPSFRSNNFVGNNFVARGPGVRFANPGYRRYGGHFRRYGFVGLPLAVGAYAGYSYYNDYNECYVPQTVQTPYGYQTQLVNVCEDYAY